MTTRRTTLPTAASASTWSGRPGTPEVPGRDLAEVPAIARALRWPPVRFLLILPALVMLALVLASALLGPANPRANLATTLTWNVWFCLLFVLVLVTGRGWCVICPFGGLAESLQRRAFWGRGRPAGLGLMLPQRLTQYGYLIPVGTLVLLTWVEERFAIAEGRAAVLTGYLLAVILLVTVGGFLVLQGRGYCRYLCPLSGLIGILGAVAPVAGFRSRDRSTCHDCRTRECLRGSAATSGCPWYAWPGSEESNLSCGLCGECFSACPTDQVGLYLTAPLESVIRLGYRRADVGWGVAVLLGLAVQEQVHLTGQYQGVEGWLNRVVPLPEIPNVLAYLATITLVTLVIATPAWLAGAISPRLAIEKLRPSGPLRPRDRDGGTFVYRRSPFRSCFLPLTYACIPLVGADYLACQLPGFIQGSTAALTALARPFASGAGNAASLTHTALLSPTATVLTQVGVVVAGILASVYAAWRIAAPAQVRRPTSRLLAGLGMGTVIVAVGAVLLLLILAPLLAAQAGSADSTQPWLT